MSSMTAEPRSELLPPHGRPLTRADLAGLPDEGHRLELVDGVLIVSPAPSLPHQTALLMLAVRLVAACPADLRVVTAPFDVVIADDTVLQPDLLVARRAEFTHQELPGPPALAVEVLSPSTRHLDLAFKRARYETAGCPSYWVIDPLQPSIVGWELQDGEYLEVVRATGEQRVALTQPFPISFAPTDLID
jgi:Uma2 family endonuclease